MAQRGRPRKDEVRETAERVAGAIPDALRQAAKATAVFRPPARRGDVRFGDVALATAFAVGSALWTATRPTTGSQVGWGAFLAGLGGLAGAEAEGAFLKFAGLGTMGANAAYLALRAVRPNLEPRQKQTTSQHAQVGPASGYMF